MKKIILTLVFAFVAIVSFGQNKWQKEKINQFVDDAVKEFKLDDSQKEKLVDFRTKMVLAYSDLQNKRKSGEISKEEGKEISKKLASEFHNSLIKLTGKNYKELSSFLKIQREKLKN
ncbi:hypothetical protein [Polaribacter staleyi]|uniref:hypothetical protein n=1 Tax=Polaribacter staleyi TaxID=2022337 RepID=UPI0031B9EC7C